MHSLGELRVVFSYDPTSGKIFWVKKANRGIEAGQEAGTITNKGYRFIKYKGIGVMAHRLAWLLAYGEWPTFQVDHIDGDRLNNRIDNLRKSSARLNQQNLHGPRSHNKCGLLGVRRYRSGRFQASIVVDGKWKYLGTFDTAEEAHSAYLSAKRQLHPACTI